MTKYETSKAMCNSSEEECDLRRGPWTLEEDNLLIYYISCHGEGRWNWLAKCAGLKRTGKSCRLRWLNYLKPDIKRGNLTPHEQLLILELHSRWGNRWSKIAQHLPGRTDNEIKNYWRTRVQKQARQLKVDADSSTFLEVIRCHWMPRLLDKMEQPITSSSSASSSPSSSSTSTSLETHQDSSKFAQLATSHTLMLESSPSSSSSSSSPITDHMDKLKSSSDCSSERVLMNLPAAEENRFVDPIYRNIDSYGNPIEDDFYCLDVTRYSSEYNSEQAMSDLGGQDPSLSQYLMVEADCFSDDLAGTIWNTDELWPWYWGRNI